MYFDSFGAVLAMDGHGPYVWAAYAITLLVLALVLSAPGRRRRRLLRQVRGELRREANQGSRETVHAPGS
ncbi:MAG TPA: heme exporter protein CcmD [Pseudohaliea sp.]|nr:heme exporter protein CcmD [Pseudohaliea sp.]